MTNKKNRIIKKFLFTILLILVAVIIFAQGQPVIWSGTAGNTHVHDPSNGPTDDLQILPGDALLWSQGPTCFNIVTSEVISEIGVTSSCADDFMFTSTQNITAARWWFGYYNVGYSPITSWTITIYDDAACLPGNIVQQYIIPFNLSNEFFHCNGSYDVLYSYWANLTPVFTAAANTKYWISVQTSDHAFLGQWGWDMIGTVTGCQGAFKSAYFGYPDYVPAGNIMGYPIDFSFELYGKGAGIVTTPISNWALFIGIGLILILAIIRFRRLI